MQFWYTETGNFRDVFMFLNEWCNIYTEIGKFSDDSMSWTRYAIFHWVDILHFPDTLQTNEKYQLMQQAFLGQKLQQS